MKPSVALNSECLQSGLGVLRHCMHEVCGPYTCWDKPRAVMMNVDTRERCVSVSRSQNYCSFLFCGELHFPNEYFISTRTVGTNIEREHSHQMWTEVIILGHEGHIFQPISQGWQFGWRTLRRHHSSESIL